MPVQHWMIEKSVERYERLLETDLDDAGRATINKLLALERAKLLRQCEDLVELAA
jgi:hypothetical protein